MRILIADDNRSSRLVLAARLKLLGHEVVEVQNGRQAWEALEQEEFPLLISDWEMPELDGLGLCRSLRARAAARHPYIILLTARTDPASYRAAREAGVDAFMTKPLAKEDLAVRLRVAEEALRLEGEPP